MGDHQLQLCCWNISPFFYMRVSENLLSWVKRVETVWALVAYDDGGCSASPPLNRASDSPASATASDASAEKAAEENFKCHNRSFHPRSSHLDLGWTLSNWQSALAGFYMYKLLVRESSPFDLLSFKCLPVTGKQRGALRSEVWVRWRQLSDNWSSICCQSVTQRETSIELLNL